MGDAGNAVDGTAIPEICETERAELMPRQQTQARPRSAATAYRRSRPGSAVASVAMTEGLQASAAGAAMTEALQARAADAHPSEAGNAVGRTAIPEVCETERAELVNRQQPQARPRS